MRAFDADGLEGANGAAPEALERLRELLDERNERIGRSDPLAPCAPVIERRESRERWPVVRRGERAPIPWLIRLSVYLRDDYVCSVCGVCFTARNAHLLQLDHCIPWSAGGPDDSDNLRAVCETCNIARSNHVDPAHTRQILPTTWWCGDCWTHDRQHPHHPWANGINLAAAPLIDTEGAEAWRLAFCATCRYINTTPLVLAGATGRRLINLTTPRSTDAPSFHDPLRDA